MSRSRKNPRKSRNRKRPAQAYGDAPTPAQLRVQEQWDRERQERKRYICNGFYFWRACAEKSCRRTKACMGDAVACFKRCWPWVYEGDKIFFRAGIKARAAGLSVDEACRAANEEVARSADHIARVEAETLARYSAEQAARDGQ